MLGKLGRLIDKYLRYRDRELLEDMPLSSSSSNIDREYHASQEIKKPLIPREASQATGERRGHMPAIATYIRLESPPEDKASYRSWYTPGQDAICINREHAEFLLSQREDRRCLRYLFSIWAKERVLQEYGAYAEKVADEMVGVLAEAEPLLW